METVGTIGYILGFVLRIILGLYRDNDSII